MRAYCKWAGLRLPTEFEFQRACRGTSKNPFPWGDEWEDNKYAATAEIKRVNETFLVASFADGVSPDACCPKTEPRCKFIRSRHFALMTGVDRHVHPRHEYWLATDYRNRKFTWPCALD